MLDADLSKVRVLMLTSHVWDTCLLHKLDSKLAAEMIPGSFVIDYSGRLAKSQPDAFETVAKSTHATSWAPDTCFHVFRRREMRLRQNCAQPCVGAAVAFVAVGLAIDRANLCKFV